LTWALLVTAKMEKINVKYLKEIGEVDEHIVSCLLLAACNVETDSHNIEGFTTLRKFVLHREGVHPCGRQADDIGETKDVGYTLYPLACC